MTSDIAWALVGLATASVATGVVLGGWYLWRRR